MVGDYVHVVAAELISFFQWRPGPPEMEEEARAAAGDRGGSDRQIRFDLLLAYHSHACRLGNILFLYVFI